MAKGTSHFRLLDRFLRRQYNAQSRDLWGRIYQLASSDYGFAFVSCSKYSPRAKEVWLTVHGGNL
jgi:hypothetical protein